MIVLRTNLRLSNCTLPLHRLVVLHRRRMTSKRVQPVDAPMTKSATFLVFSLKDRSRATLSTVRKVLASTQDLCKNVRVRDPTAQFACTVGIGSALWPEVTDDPPPKELHPFVEVRGKGHTAVSTPGDLFYHIRADRRDLCFTFEQQLMSTLRAAVHVEDCTIGFRYFDARDLLGFVDGTANPDGEEATKAVFISETGEKEHDSAAGGSYVVVQKYLHDIEQWQSLPTHAQEAILGRRKFDNVELDDAGEQEQKSHKTLCTIEEQGQEFSILRDNMPFGTPCTNTFGTYFIGYSKQLWVVERMLERMFKGVPDGKYDRTLDYSTPVTGSVFFVPSVDFLESLDDS